MAGELGVEPARALGERGEAGVAGGEADAGADGGDVVEVAPDPLELEQDRAGAGELGGRLAGRAPPRRRGRRRRRSRPRRRRRRAPTNAHAAVERRALGGPLEPAVLVEEAGVEVQDAVADDVEAEVAGLDHARVDRPDRDLVGVVRRAPGRSSCRVGASWSTSGRSGSWPAKSTP